MVTTLSDHRVPRCPTLDLQIFIVQNFLAQLFFCCHEILFSDYSNRVGVRARSLVSHSCQHPSLALRYTHQAGQELLEIPQSLSSHPLPLTPDRRGLISTVGQAEQIVSFLHKKVEGSSPVASFLL